MTVLWGLAREAFNFDVEDKHRYENLVVQQFIHGLKNPHIKSNLRISKPDTTNEAVDRACELSVDFSDELQTQKKSISLGFNYFTIQISVFQRSN